MVILKFKLKLYISFNYKISLKKVAYFKFIFFIIFYFNFLLCQIYIHPFKHDPSSNLLKSL